MKETVVNLKSEIVVVGLPKNMAILETAQNKQTGNMKGLVVTGCLVQRYADEMRESDWSSDVCSSDLS